jgi:uncharacterized protein (UPF0548 family)
MATDRSDLMGPPRARRRLSALSATPLNFDRDGFGDPPHAGYTVDDVRHGLPAEVAGDPVPGGSWETARRLIDGYEFADPSIVRAYYDPEGPLKGRRMLLRLRALGLFRVYVGVRVLEVIDEERELSGRRARVWGWTYGTLQGHVESGEMSWQVWKWLDSGEVEFRVHAISRRAAIRNPIVRLGFMLVGPHERKVFLRSTGERMTQLTQLGLRIGSAQALRAAADDLTARPMRSSDAASDALSHGVAEPGHEGN